MSAGSTQAERALPALRRGGARGVTQVDFLLGGAGVIDGGAPITRLPARIDELRKQGHTIATAGRRQRCIIYRYVAGPPVVRIHHDRDGAHKRGLFCATIGTAPPRSATDPEAA